ncbi:MAG: ORC1-type DNA replication protein [Methanoculleaceae archaeon]
MRRDMLMWDETLFRDPDVFELDYIPDQFNYRETQMHELAACIRPALRGARPLNSICRGLPGTGKTTTVRKIFSTIEEETRKILPVYINCQIENTKFAIFSRIYQRLSGRPPPASGTSFKQIFDATCRLILREGSVLVVALDDINYLLYEGEINRVLYTLLRAHEAADGVRIGIIAIVSDMNIDLPALVDARVASVFRPTEIYFAPYTEEEVRGILRERALQGFYPGVLPEAMLDLVVEMTLRAGDLRVGIDLLKRAGLGAEMDARRQIRRDDICGAYEVSRYQHLRATLASLRADEREVLGKIAEMGRGREEEMTAGEIYSVVSTARKIGYTRFYEMVQKFDTLRLIDLQYRQGRGRTRIVNLRYPPERILEMLS